MDDDAVDFTNVTTQGHLWEYAQQSRAKVEATQAAILRLDPQFKVSTVRDRFHPRHEVGDVVFCCVDSIPARKAIWRSVQDRCGFFCDGRMLGEVARIITVDRPEARERYRATLFPQAEAQS